jgi:hypothetical protein
VFDSGGSCAARLSSVHTSSLFPAASPHDACAAGVRSPHGPPSHRGCESMAQAQQRWHELGRHIGRGRHYVLLVRRLCVFLFGSFRLALNPSGQVKKFPNEIVKRVSGCIVQDVVHAAQAYYMQLLLFVLALHAYPQANLQGSPGTHFVSLTLPWFKLRGAVASVCSCNC